MNSLHVFTSSCLLLLTGCSALRPKPQIITRVDTVTMVKEVPPPLPAGDTVEVCLSTGMPAQVMVTASGDTLVNGVPIRSVRPVLTFGGSYLEQRVDTLHFERRLYRKAGLVERKACDELKLVGHHGGVPVFADITAPQTLPTIFLPLRPSVFQPYTTPTPKRRR